jgi:hypothetical protein
VSARNGAATDSVSEIGGRRVVASKRDGDSSQPHSQQAQGEARTVIRAELSWSDHATACGIVARGSSPVLKLCRMLVEAGYDPRTLLEGYRGATLCLKVRSIGEAAGLEVDRGCRFVRAHDRPRKYARAATATKSMIRSTA